MFFTDTDRVMWEQYTVAIIHVCDSVRDSPSRYLAHQLVLGQRSQGHKGNRLAGVSYALYWVPSL